MTDDQLKAMFDALGNQIVETTDVLRQETRAAIVELRREITESADRTIAESRHLFRIEADGLRQEIQLVAEGDVLTREKLDREAADIREEVRRTANETQAMFSRTDAGYGTLRK